jgi:hypothetical protein
LEEEAIRVQPRGVDGVGVDGGGAVGLPLASAPSVIGWCLGFVGHCVGTVNVGSRALSVPPFIWRCARGGPLPQERQAPPIRTRGENLP